MNYKPPDLVAHQRAVKRAGRDGYQVYALWRRYWLRANLWTRDAAVNGEIDNPATVENDRRELLTMAKAAQVKMVRLRRWRYSKGAKGYAPH